MTGGEYVYDSLPRSTGITIMAWNEEGGQLTLNVVGAALMTVYDFMFQTDPGVAALSINDGEKWSGGDGLGVKTRKLAKWIGHVEKSGAGDWKIAEKGKTIKIGEMKKGKILMIRDVRCSSITSTRAPRKKPPFPRHLGALLSRRRLTGGDRDLLSAYLVRVPPLTRAHLYVDRIRARITGYTSF